MFLRFQFKLSMSNGDSIFSKNFKTQLKSKLNSLHIEISLQISSNSSTCQTSKFRFYSSVREISNWNMPEAFNLSASKQSTEKSSNILICRVLPSQFSTLIWMLNLSSFSPSMTCHVMPLVMEANKGTKRTPRQACVENDRNDLDVEFASEIRLPLALGSLLMESASIFARNSFFDFS